MEVKWIICQKLDIHRSFILFQCPKPHDFPTINGVFIFWGFVVCCISFLMNLYIYGELWEVYGLRDWRDTNLAVKSQQLSVGAFSSLVSCVVPHMVPPQTAWLYHNLSSTGGCPRVGIWLNHRHLTVISGTLIGSSQRKCPHSELKIKESFTPRLQR